MKGRFIKVDLSGKVAVVTGAARGIGKAIAEAFAENGAKVVIADIDIDEAKKTADSIGELAVAVKVDVTSCEAVEQMFKETEEKCGGTADIVVNNAGTQIALHTVEDMPMDVWNKAVALNLTSAMICSKYAIPAMKKKGWGRLIHTSSISANSGGGPGGSSYAAAKGGLSNLTKGLAKEVGPHGITSNAFAPGVVLTQIHEKFSTKESLESLKGMTPVGRLSVPEDIAGVVIFLASDSASYINGECIAINGGLRMD